MRHEDLLFMEYLGEHPFQRNKRKDVWKPKEKPAGEIIPKEEILQNQNYVIQYRKKLSSIGIHSPLLEENNVGKEDAKKKWEETAEEWINILENQGNKGDEGDRNRQWIIDPHMWELIGSVNREKVLDAGCGNGYFTRKLAKKGALAFGVDQSSRLINYCKNREKKEPQGCKFFQGDLTDLQMFETNTFDLVVSNIVMIDVRDYQLAFRKIYRVLKPNGRFIWSNTHPVFGRLNAVDFRIPRDIVRKEERIGKLIDRYFDSGAMLISWGKIKPIWQFERTLEEYSKALKNAGFAIVEIREPKPSNETIIDHFELAYDVERYPHFIIFECIPFMRATSQN